MANKDLMRKIRHTLPYGSVRGLRGFLNRLPRRIAVSSMRGLVLGIKKFRLVWVFENQSGLNSFIDSGWEFGGQATAAAQASGQGGAFAGAMSVSPGVWLYQLTDDGLALELTAKGTKYYKDGDLNK